MKIKNFHRFASTQKDNTSLTKNDNIKMDITMAGSVNSQ
jgi:hypothetical protein